MTLADKYPGIMRAALEIAYDNGGVHRCRPERVTIDAAVALLASPAASGFDLAMIDAWLSQLSADDLTTLSSGSEDDMARVMQTAPHGTDDLLDLIFEAPVA